MNINRLIFLIAATGLLLTGPLLAAPKVIPNPDFTKGESIPEDAAKDWTLGATGARGWMHMQGLKTVTARQIAITEVASGSPASGILKEGDVLLGVAGKAFSYDPRVELGKALTAAEATDGQLRLIRWRDGQTEEVTLELEVLGRYSPTAPYNCPKSAKILEEACESLARRMKNDDYDENAISRSLNALGLLASGDPKYDSLVKREARWAADFTSGGYASWWYGYVTIFLAEYILATDDKSMLPDLKRLAMEVAEGQSNVGSWGHRFADSDGRLFGYGMMNSPGLPLTIGLVLAYEAGVDEPEVKEAIMRSTRLLRFYIGKGSVPYGDHAPFMNSHEDNGKCGMAAVLFDQLGDKEGTKFFSKMSTASHSGERDHGHTGNFFNMTWAMPGVSRAGPYATGAWMWEFGSWYFDLARNADWSFPHQGPPQSRPDSYGKWDATGMYLIAYAMPRKAIRLTGSKPSSMDPLKPAEAARVVKNGRVPCPIEPMEALSSWSPIIRERAAKELAKSEDVRVQSIIKLLDAPTVEARQGACTALAALGTRAEPAIPDLLEALNADDLWLRVKAGEALASIGEPAKRKALPILLERLAVGPTKEDPRGMEQRYLVSALFHPRTGMLRGSLDGVDQELLLTGIKSALKNEDGHTRANAARAYDLLSLKELEPILPSVHQAIIEKSPSGIMFDGGAQDAGLEFFSKNHISEGIELIAHYTYLQKGHGSENRLPKYIEMLKRYGAHAQRAIPILEKAADYFENHEENFPRHLSLEKAKVVRNGIDEIKKLKETPKLIQLNL